MNPTSTVLINCSGRRALSVLLGLAGFTLGQLPATSAAQELIPRLKQIQPRVLGDTWAQRSQRAKSVTPSYHYFPDTAVGGESVVVITLTNTEAYGGPLTINGPPTISGGGFVASTLSAPCSGGVLAAGASCQVAAYFRPTAQTYYYGSLDFNTTPATGSVYLDGWGVPLIMPVVNPNGLDFGVQPVATESPMQRVTISNTSAEYRLNVDTILVDSPFEGVFCEPVIAGVAPQPGGAKRLGPACNFFFYGSLVDEKAPPPETLKRSKAAKAAMSLGACPQGNFSLYYGEYCHVDVFFTPPLSGQFSGNLTVRGSLGQQRSIPLTGSSGPRQAISTTPESLAFGDVMLRRSAGPAPIAIANTGFEPLVINSITVVPPSGTPVQASTLKAITAAADYELTHNCGALDPNATCSAQVKFAPTELGPRPAAVMIEGTFEGSPRYVPLSGVGLPIPFPFLTYSVSSISFGRSLPIVGNSVSFAINNSGQLPVQFGTIYARGDFSLTHNCPASLVAGQVCQVTVTYRASVPGGSSGEVVIESNAQEVNRSIPVSGTSCRPFTLRGARQGLGSC